MQSEDYKAFAETQTDKTGTQHQTEISEQCVSRINHNIASHEECAPNEEPPTMDQHATRRDKPSYHN